MTTSPAAPLTDQIHDLGISASYYLAESSRSLRTMAAEAQAQAARLIAVAEAVESRKAALDEALDATPGLDFRLDNAVGNITDAAFGALNTTNLVSRASQAVTAANRAVEAVNSARTLSADLLSTVTLDACPDGH